MVPCSLLSESHEKTIQCNFFRFRLASCSLQYDLVHLVFIARLRYLLSWTLLRSLSLNILRCFTTLGRCFSLICKNVYFVFLTKFLGFQTAWSGCKDYAYFNMHNSMSRNARSEAKGEVESLASIPFVPLTLHSGHTAGSWACRTSLGCRWVQSKACRPGLLGFPPRPGWESQSRLSHTCGLLARAPSRVAFPPYCFCGLPAYTATHTPKAPTQKMHFLMWRNKRMGNLSIRVCVWRLLLLQSSSLFLEIWSIFLI